MRYRRAALVGGSGFLGHALTHWLTSARVRVSIACRRPHRARDLLIHQTRLVPANAITGKGLEAALAGADVVYYLVGLLYEKGRQTFEGAHVEGVERTIEAMKRLGIRRIIHVSALGVDRVPDSAYARTKLEGEARVRASGLDWTIVRPAVIYGAGDGFITRLKRLAQRLPVLPLIGAETKMQPVWVEDVARALARMPADKQAIGETIELAGPEVFSLEEIARIVLDELGLKRRIVRVGDGIARFIASLAEWLPRPPITLDQLELLRHDNVATGDPFPARYGHPARLAEVLPTFIHGHQAEWMQRRFDDARRRYRNMLAGGEGEA